jgi:hypothetical protein
MYLISHQVYFPSITVCNLNRVNCHNYRKVVKETDCSTAAADRTACEVREGRSTV